MPPLWILIIFHFFSSKYIHILRLMLELSFIWVLFKKMLCLV